MNTICADFPPNSSVIFFRLLAAAAAIIFLPVRVEPVNATFKCHHRAYGNQLERRTEEANSCAIYLVDVQVRSEGRPANVPFRDNTIEDPWREPDIVSRQANGELKKFDNSPSFYEQLAHFLQMKP